MRDEECGGIEWAVVVCTFVATILILTLLLSFAILLFALILAFVRIVICSNSFILTNVVVITLCLALFFLLFFV